MAIDRTWWNNLVDDTGTGTTGTVWNKATIKGLLDAIDAMFPGGVWHPTDGSPAGLVLTEFSPCVYTKAGNIALVAFNLGYPGQANGSNAAIYGLPFQVGYTAAASGLVYSNFGDVLLVSPVVNAYSATISSKTGAAITNAQLSGKQIAGGVIYYTV